MECFARSQSSESRQSDLITTLVNVYGSKEVFVSEYKSLLAEKLLAKADFDTELCVSLCSTCFSFLCLVRCDSVQGSAHAGAVEAAFRGKRILVVRNYGAQLCACISPIPCLQWHFDNKL